MQEQLPTVSFSLRKIDTSKILKLLGNTTIGSQQPNIHALLDSYKTTEAEKLFVRRTQPGKNQIEVRIPTSVELAKLCFSAHMGKNHVHVQTVNLVHLDKEEDVLRPQRGEMIISCRIDFSGTKTPGPMTVLEELLLKAEKQRSKELESRAGWYSDEFLPKVVEEAKKQSFKFISQSSMLMGEGMLQLTLSTETVETHSPRIANCQKNKGALEVVIGRKMVVGRISQWEPDSRTLFLKLDRYETLSSELFQDIPAALDITYDACGDLRILLLALGRLKHSKAQMESFPLDLFLFGEDEDILNQTRPLGEKDIVDPISHYLRDDLNEEQKEAIELALATPDFFLLQGPPGTGKTTFIAELCYQFIQRGKKVLVASQSNAAVNNAIARLAMHPDLLAVRLGKEDKLAAMSENFVKQKAVLRWLQSTVQESSKELQELKDNSSIFQRIFCNEWETLCKHYHILSETQKDFSANLPVETNVLSTGLVPTLPMANTAYRPLSELESEMRRLHSIYKVKSKKQKELQKLIGTQPLELSPQSIHQESAGFADVQQRINHAWILLKSYPPFLFRSSPFGLSKESICWNIECWENCELEHNTTKAEVLFSRIKEQVLSLKRLAALPLAGRFWRSLLCTVENRLQSAIAHIQDVLLRQEYAQVLEETRKADEEYQEALSTYKASQYRQAYLDLQQRWHCIQQSSFVSTQWKDTQDLPPLSVFKSAKEQWLASWEWRTLSARMQILEEWTATIDQNLEGADVSITEQIWKRFLQHVNVCGATCAHTGMEGFFKTFSNFDVVIIDEVSKAAITELVAPCMPGKKIILVGDHKQLPPTITPEMEQSIQIVAQDDADGNEENARYNEIKVKEWLTAKVFEKRFEFFSQYAPDYQRTIMLTKQYRMHSQIMTAINQFYNGLLTQGCADQERQHHLSRKWWLQHEDSHLVWIDTSECKEWKHEQDGPSRKNPQEARLIINILRDILEDLVVLPAQQEILEVGVISVYRAQANLIEKMFILEKQQDEHFSNIAAHIHVRFGTVDEFQGVEKDIILLSLVLNSRKNEMSSFLENPKRINVAMSRAKRLLLIIGSKYNYIETQNEASEFYRHIYSLADQINAPTFKEQEEHYCKSVPDSSYGKTLVASNISIGKESTTIKNSSIGLYPLLECFIIRCLLELSPCKTRQIEELLCLQKVPLVEIFMEQLKKEGYIRKSVTKNWIVEDQERLRNRYLKTHGESCLPSQMHLSNLC